MAGGTDEPLRCRIEAQALKTLEAVLPAGLSAPEVANRVYRVIRQVSGNDDPYREAKKHEMQLAREASGPFPAKAAAGFEGMRLPGGFRQFP